MATYDPSVTFARLFSGVQAGEMAVPPVVESEQDHIDTALALIAAYGQIDESHHQAWVLDQVVRIFMGDRYDDFIGKLLEDEDDEWDVGIAP